MSFISSIKNNPRRSLQVLAALVLVAFSALALWFFTRLVSTPQEPVIETAALSPYPAACGNCGSLCQQDLFDRAADKPDSLIACSLLHEGLGLAVLRGPANPQLWLVGDSMLVRADATAYGKDGVRLADYVLQHARQNWPWLWDVPQTAQAGAVQPRPAPPSPPPPQDIQAVTPPSPWVAFTTDQAHTQYFAGKVGDFRESSADQFDRFMEWLDLSWPAPAPWTRMAWIDPHCPHCKRLVDSESIEHFAPRIIMDAADNGFEKAQAAAGWLMQGTPDMDRFMRLEPADPDLTARAQASQDVFDQLFWQLRQDWGVVVPIQALRGDGWIVFWVGAEEPPALFAALSPPTVQDQAAVEDAAL